MVVIIILMGQLVRASRLTNKSKQIRLEKKSVGIIIMMIKVFVNFNRRDMAFIMVFMLRYLWYLLRYLWYLLRYLWYLCGF